jgi:hypothetical protein
MLIKIRDIDTIKAVYKCDCGAEVELYRSNVTVGHTKSCGCLRRRAIGDRNLKHGHKPEGVPTRTYSAWVNMKTRCNNPSRSNSKNYIGRGINYCERWEFFVNFLEDMGVCPDRGTIDRINNDLGYYKENCRWATMKEQNLNKRNNVRHEYKGKAQTLTDWSEELGIGRVTLLKRLQRGVPIEIAFNTDKYLSYAPRVIENPKPRNKPVDSEKRAAIVKGLYEYKGKTQSVQAWADELGIKRPTLIKRLYGGMPIEKAFSTADSLVPEVRYTFQGKTLPLSAWEKELGIGRKTLGNRLNKGVPVEIAFTTKGYLSNQKA